MDKLKEASLNPYCSWTWTSTPESGERTFVSFSRVLILIVVGRGLVRYQGIMVINRLCVLILIVVGRGLVPMSGGSYSN